MNKILANKLYVSVINYDEEDDFSALAHRQKHAVDPNNTALYSCRVHIECIASTKSSQNDDEHKDEESKPSLITLENIEDLRNLPTEIDYAHLEEYTASKQTFVTIDEDMESVPSKQDETDNDSAGELEDDTVDDEVAAGNINETETKRRKNSLSLINDDAGPDL